MTSVIIKKCPSCGSNKINKVCRDWKSTIPGKKYTISSLEFYECPECGDELYDREAMRKIEAVSPTYKKIRRRQKKVA